MGDRMMAACVVSVGTDTDTVCRAIASSLAGAGFSVTWLVAGDAPGPESRLPIAVERLDIAHAPESVRPAVRRAYSVWQWCRARAFDLICYPDCGGAGHFLAVARRLGLDPSRTVLLAHSTGPTLWRLECNGRLPGVAELELDHMERVSVAAADMMVVPARTIVRWMEAQAWQLPDSVRVAGPRAPQGAGVSPASRAVRALVFHGNLERRSGLITFVQALRRVPPHLLSSVRVLLRGVLPGDATAWQPHAWLRSAMPTAASWEVCPPEPYDPVGVADGADSLIVLPAETESMASTVRACLESGTPFLACDTEETRALVHPGDHASLLADATPPLLADALTRALVQGVRAARPVALPGPAPGWPQAIRDLVTHRQVAPARQAPVTTAATVSVVLTHRNRPNLLAQALDGLRGQTAHGFEVVLVDDGSDLADAHTLLDRLEPEFARRGWRIVRQANRYLGAARNAGWRAARGRYILFHDDDNVTRPDAIDALIGAAAHSGAAVITSAFHVFEGDGPPPVPADRCPELFVGGALAAGLYANVFGDAQALVRRDVLEQLGGFTEDFGTGHEDWELFARAALKGFEVISLPVSLFWYRVNAGSMVRARPDPQPDLCRNSRAYTELLPPAAAPLARAAIAGMVGAGDAHLALQAAEAGQRAALESEARAREAQAAVECEASRLREAQAAVERDASRLREALTAAECEASRLREALTVAECEASRLSQDLTVADHRVGALAGQLTAAQVRETAAATLTRDIRQHLQQAEVVLGGEGLPQGPGGSQLEVELVGVREQSARLTRGIEELDREIRGAADAVARSRSMRLTHDLRNAVNRWRRRPAEVEPTLRGATLDRFRALVLMLTSDSWTLAAPLRFVSRLRPRSPPVTKG